MTLLQATFLTAFLFGSLVNVTPAPAALSRGYVYHYSPGMMRTVANNQGIPMRWGEVDGFASTRDCSKGYAPLHPDIRKHPWVVVASIDDTPAQRFEIVDCSNPRDIAHHRAIGLILEVDYGTAAELAASGYPRLKTSGKTTVKILGYGRLP